MYKGMEGVVWQRGVREEDNRILLGVIGVGCEREEWGVGRGGVWVGIEKRER